MTLAEAESALRQVYERHAMASLQRDRQYGAYNGLDMLPRPASLRQCVEAIEELTQKTVAIEIENENSTPVRLRIRVNAAINLLGPKPD